jgi:hypothetical protein
MIRSGGVAVSQWPEILRARGWNIKRAQQLFDRLMTATTNNTSYSLMVIPGRLFESDDTRILAVANIRAREAGLTRCDPEAACLVANLIKVHDFRSMGFNTLIFVCDYGMCLLEIEQDGGHRFSFDQLPTHKQWPEETGFVFTLKADPIPE